MQAVPGLDNSFSGECFQYSTVLTQLVSFERCLTVRQHKKVVLRLMFHVLTCIGIFLHGDMIIKYNFRIVTLVQTD